MAEKQVRAREALSYGWARMKENLGTFVWLCLLSWLLSGLQAGINRWHGAAVGLRWLLSPLPGVPTKLEARTVGEAMSAPGVTIGPKQQLTEAANTMIDDDADEMIKPMNTVSTALANRPA